MKKIQTTLFFVVFIVFVVIFSFNTAYCVNCDSTIKGKQGDGTKDLDVNGKNICIGPGTYKYKFVNIYAKDGKKGSLTFLDQGTINFWAKSILVENNGSLIAGSTTNPYQSNLNIYLYGSDNDKKAITCKTGDNCGFPGTWSSSGTSATLPGGVTDTFYKYEPLPGDYDTNGTPTLATNAYFGRKVLAVSYGGTLQLFGNKGTTYDEASLNAKITTNPSYISGNSWVRLAQSAVPGDNVLTLDRNVDWKKGDEIVVTTTDYIPGHSEKLTITSVPSTLVNVLNPKEGVSNLAYHHFGKKYSLSKVPSRLNLERTDIDNRAAVALLTRNIRILSGGDTVGSNLSDTSYFGGHTIIRQGAKNVQIQGVEFNNLGQGGRMAHAPVNFHLVRKAPTNTFVKDCSINESMNRWIVVRGTQNVTFSRNVGYKSIGHGYFIADGSEINNTFTGNVGILARAAVKNKQNPRNIPGIIASVTDDGKWSNAPNDSFSHASDYYHPTLFYISNGYNNLEGNMAAGATTCGACYWFVPSKISGLSAAQSWGANNYASVQKDNAGKAPVKKFYGNSCSTAQHSLVTIGGTGACASVHTSTSGGSDVRLYPIESQFSKYYEDKSLYPSVLEGTNFNPTINTASTPCANGTEDSCLMVPFDNYTSSFHWANTNFAAIWLRNTWFVANNFALTDIQNGGLTMVSGGSPDQVFRGYWGLTRKSVFVGSTQINATNKNPFANVAGPVNNDSGLKCDSGTPAGYCLLSDDGIAYPISDFQVYQRFFNIYDGPTQQDSNAYLDILVSKWNNGTDPGYMQTRSNLPVAGIPYFKDTKGDPQQSQCILPHSAIGWKQPNGFFYPPSFHSTNVFMDNVDIFHYVIVPFFKPGTFEQDQDLVKTNYCTYSSDMFSASFTDIDRQTFLNDDDGSLSGLSNSISLNNDGFYNFPVIINECQSQISSNQVPYDSVSFFVFKEGSADGSNWATSCNSTKCYGVPIYRQFYTADEKGENSNQSMQMMGAAIGTRNVLIANNGSFYIDTTVTGTTQLKTANFINVFEPNNTYYFFNMFAKPNPDLQSQAFPKKPVTKNTFQMYVGKLTDPEGFLKNNVVAFQIIPNSTPTMQITKLTGEDWAQLGWTKKYITPEVGNTNLLEVTIDYSSDYFTKPFQNGYKNNCMPKSFCTWQSDSTDIGGKCVFDKTNAKNSGIYNLGCDKDSSKCDSMCKWATNAIDCPEGGCFGFAVTFPDNSQFTPDDSKHRPAPQAYPSNWSASSCGSNDVEWKKADSSLCNSSCDTCSDDCPTTHTAKFMTKASVPYIYKCDPTTESKAPSVCKTLKSNKAWRGCGVVYDPTCATKGGIGCNGFGAPGCRQCDSISVRSCCKVTGACPADKSVYDTCQDLINKIKK